MAPNNGDCQDDLPEGISQEEQWQVSKRKPRRGSKHQKHQHDRNTADTKQPLIKHHPLEPEVCVHVSQASQIKNDPVSVCKMDSPILPSLENQQIVLALACLKRRILLEGLIAAAVMSFDIGTLFLDTENKDSHMIRAVHSLGDFHSVLDIVRRWCKVLQSGKIADHLWCVQHGFNRIFLQDVEGKVQDLYSKLKTKVKDSELPALNFRANHTRSDEQLLEAFCDIYGSHISVYRGHDSLGYQKVTTSERFSIEHSSVLNIFWKWPSSILPVTTKNFGPYYIVLPDLIAERLVPYHTGKSLQDIKDSLVLQKFNISNVGRKIRDIVLSHFANNSSASEGFFQELTAMGVENPRESVKLQKDDTWFGLDVFSLATHKDTVMEALSTLIVNARDGLIQEKKEIPYPTHYNQVRLLLAKGMDVCSVLYGGEYRELGVAEAEENILDAIKSFGEVEGVRKVDPSISNGFSAIITLKDPTCASLIISKAKALGNMTIRPFQNVQRIEPRSLVDFECEVEIHACWLVHIDKYKKAQVRDEDIAVVKAGLLHLLSYIDEDKINVRVERVEGDKKHVHCFITCQDHHSSYRVLQCLQDAQHNQVPIELLNQAEVQRNLSRLIFRINSKVYEVLSRVISAKLENCERSITSNWSCDWSISNIDADNYTLEIIFNNASQCNINFYHDKIMSCLQPMVNTFDQYSTQRLSSTFGQHLMDRVMEETKTYIHIPEFKSKVHIYGSRKAASEAKKLLEIYLYNKPIFEWEKLTKDQSYPHDLNCTLSRNKSHWEQKEPCRVKIMGKDIFYVRTKYLSLQKALEQRFGKSKTEVTGVKQCDICYSECDIWSENQVPADVLGYVMESCGHRYCANCLCQQLRVTTRQSLMCGSCNCPFSVQDLLNISGLYQGPSIPYIMSNAARRFVEGNFDLYGCCSKPDCKGLFRKATKNQKSTMCCSCSREFCPLCFAQRHGKMTCEEYRMSQVTVENWMAENPSQRKKCPKCKMGIEKNGGCNHVHCVFCQISMCWVCLKTFQTSKDCYDHMESIHGGIYRN